MKIIMARSVYQQIIDEAKKAHERNEEIDYIYITNKEANKLEKELYRGAIVDRNSKPGYILVNKLMTPFQEIIIFVDDEKGK